MIKRVKQFARALFARVNEDDVDYVRRHLPEEAQQLFFAMSLIDQRHSLNVAYTAEKFVAKNPYKFPIVNADLLRRAALLHDTGRRNFGNASIIAKTLAVIIAAFCPASGERKLPDCFRLLMHIYHHHAKIGAKKLKTIGMIDEAKIIAKHHDPKLPTDGAELTILRLADEMN